MEQEEQMSKHLKAELQGLAMGVATLLFAILCIYLLEKAS